jgi:hypothetical protein
MKRKTKPAANLRNQNILVVGMLACGLCAAAASERYFTYTYEPETMPQGAWEYEQTVTARVGRDKAVRQEDYNKWEFRHELEYGVTDNYSVSLYVNESLENFRDPLAAKDRSDFRFDGISIENRYLLWNPADHAVGLTFYVEPRYSGREAELEEKIVIGQRFGEWKWALNLTHATEWSDYLQSTEGEVEVSFGITRKLSDHWSAGLEARDHNELPDYHLWENTAFYLGPVATYQRERWWATLTIMPQIVGANFAGNADNNHALELEGHERLNVRLIFGIGF